MRHHRDHLARVPRRQRQHGVDAARIEVEQALATAGREAGFALTPAAGVIGLGAFDLGVGAALEAAEAAFAQARVGDQWRASPQGQRLRGGPGALQVAAVDGGQRLVGLGFGLGFGNTLGQPFGLPAAGLVQRNVELALDARLGIPGRLAVAQDEQARGVEHARRYSCSRRWFSV